MRGCIIPGNVEFCRWRILFVKKTRGGKPPKTLSFVAWEFRKFEDHTYEGKSSDESFWYKWKAEDWFEEECLKKAKYTHYHPKKNTNPKKIYEENPPMQVRVRKLAEHFEPKPKSFSPHPSAHCEGNQRFNTKGKVSTAIRKKGKQFGHFCNSARNFKGDSTGQGHSLTNSNLCSAGQR